MMKQVTAMVQDADTKGTDTGLPNNMNPEPTPIVTLIDIAKV